MILSLVSLGLGYATEKMEIFKGANEALRGVWNELGLTMNAEMGLPGLAGIVATSIAVVWVIVSILCTPGEGRRVILGVSALLLAAALVPCFAVWGIMWKPFGIILALIWGWLSAVIYARNHVMPCEISLSVAAENVVIPMKGNHTVESSQHVDG